MAYMQLRRALLESIVGRYLDEIRQDPKRSLRNLVDLGREAAGGKLQQGFLELVQRMLKRADSPYYTLARNAVSTVERGRLLTFGVNLGWNSLVQGGKRLRKLEEQRGHGIPWDLTLRMAAGEDSLTAGDYRRLTGEGMDLGIYSYFLLPEDGPSAEAALALSEDCPGCAFCLLLPRDFDVGTALPRLERCPNVMVGVGSGGDGWEQAAGQLREGRFLYLLYRRYRTADDAEDITSGTWAERILPHAGMAALLISGLEGGAPEAVARYARDSRIEQRYPTLVFNFYSDFLDTGGRLSGHPCFLSILPDGTAAGCRDGREVRLDGSVRETALDGLLGRLFPL